MAVKSSPSEPIFANLDGLLAELRTVFTRISILIPSSPCRRSGQRVWLRATCAPSASGSDYRGW